MEETRWIEIDGLRWSSDGRVEVRRKGGTTFRDLSTVIEAEIAPLYGDVNIVGCGIGPTPPVDDGCVSLRNTPSGVEVRLPLEALLRLKDFSKRHDL